MQDTQVHSHTSLFRRKYKTSRRPRSRPTSRKASSISFREADFRTNYLQLVAGFIRGISKKKKVTARVHSTCIPRTPAECATSAIFTNTLYFDCGDRHHRPSMSSGSEGKIAHVLRRD